MKLKKSTEYAIRILSFMARSDKELISAKEILDTIDIPPKYMRRIMTELSASKFIRSVKGRNGGYIFCKKIKDINLTDIINAMEGSESNSACILGLDDCSCETPCVMHDTWMDTKERIIKTFETTNLSNFKSPDIKKL